MGELDGYPVAAPPMTPVEASIFREMLAEWAANEALRNAVGAVASGPSEAASAVQRLVSRLNRLTYVR